jgi:site-specific recombinase XerD
MSKTFKILFYLKKPKDYSIGSSLPIYLRLTVDGERVEMFTQRNCDPDKWNSEAGRSKGNKEEVKQLNNYLDLLRTKIFEAQRELLNTGFPVTASNIRNKMQGKEERKKTLLEVYDYHNKQIAELVGKEFAPGTLKKFKTAYTSVIDFIQWKFRSDDLPIKSLNFQFITDYEFYLKSVRSLQHNTVMGMIKKLKKIVRQCVANEWLDRDPFMSYRVKVRETIPVCLSEEELHTIETKKFVSSRLSQVRDIFVFSCYTGLAYTEAYSLNHSHINIGIDGERWIFIQRRKTIKHAKLSKIPLLDVPQMLLEKYKDHPVCKVKGSLLPALSNQKMNEYLKEIAAVCSISKELSFHTARHTFATTMLNNGVSLEAVSDMLGHASIRQTQHYARVKEKMISLEMQKVRTRIAATKPQNDIARTGS